MEEGEGGKGAWGGGREKEREELGKEMETDMEMGALLYFGVLC